MKNLKKLHKIIVAVMVIALLFNISRLPVQVTQAATDSTTTTATATPTPTVTTIPIATPTPVASPADSVSNGDIVVLYDNDVHCAVDGYASIAALKWDIKKKTKYVAVVSDGDFVQGATIGALSKGENIIKIMNQVGYDVVTLGNHEFDYQLDQLTTLTNMFNGKVVSCNFVNIETKESVYKSYVMKNYGDKKVAFIGITTPESITKSTPTYFQNEKGEYIYGFLSDKTGKALYNRVQKTVDAAKKAGADYVIALAHLGTDGVTSRWTSTSVINNTTGIDVVLDGHSHSTFAESLVKNKAGEEVLVSSTGTKFANIGELIITKDGDISAQLVSLKDYTKTDVSVSAYIASIKKQYEAEVSKVIGKTTVDLTTLNLETNKRAVRNAETNMGDFCADAIRTVLGADVAIMNGGGIRDNIAKGEITYNNLLSVFPWSNMGCVVEANGQQIKDALEMGAKNYPEESGGFLQVSGITYEIDSAIPTSVQLDDTGMFVKVSGTYRVQNINILNSETGKYEPIDLTKTYKLAGINYTLKSCGDGYTMFKNNKILKDEVAVDNEILINYLVDYLDGVVGEAYSNPTGQGRIVIK